MLSIKSLTGRPPNDFLPFLNHSGWLSLYPFNISVFLRVPKSIPISFNVIRFFLFSIWGPAVCMLSLFLTSHSASNQPIILDLFALSSVPIVSEGPSNFTGSGSPAFAGFGPAKFTGS